MILMLVLLSCSIDEILRWKALLGPKSLKSTEATHIPLMPLARPCRYRAGTSRQEAVPSNWYSGVRLEEEREKHRNEIK